MKTVSEENLLATVQAALDAGLLERKIISPVPDRIVTVGIVRRNEIKLEVTVRAWKGQKGFHKHVVTLDALLPAELAALAEIAGYTVEAERIAA